MMAGDKAKGKSKKAKVGIRKSGVGWEIVHDRLSVVCWILTPDFWILYPNEVHR